MSEDLSPNEQEALALLRSERGLYQSQLWKRLDLSSRQGSRIATSLEDKGLIEREIDVFEGTRTYRLDPNEEALEAWSQGTATVSATKQADAATTELSPQERESLELIRD